MKTIEERLINIEERLEKIVEAINQNARTSNGNDKHTKDLFHEIENRIRVLEKKAADPYGGNPYGTI